ncbi:MAG: RNA-binding protein [Deltaproteobacteria bacterium]|nr:MAG: RNA-binding protein [Deltaproteobacteria bacterium]TMA74750.1 MAG: RNA-binding protein [Deltaproteobacteria bacterium]
MARLFVGNLPFDTTEAQIKQLIAGENRTVRSVKIITDKETGRSRGFAFADLDSDEEAKAAIEELNGKEFGGRPLKVNEAEERGQGAGKFGGGGGFRGTPHGKDVQGQRGFGMRGPAQNMPRGSQRGGGRGGTRGS